MRAGTEVHGAPAVPTATGSFSREQRRTLAYLRAGVVFGTLLPVLLLVLFAFRDYAEVLDEKTKATQRTAHILSEHAAKLFDTSDLVLQRLDEIAAHPDAEIHANEAVLHDKARRFVEHLPQVQSVWVVDAQGHPLLTNRYMPAPVDLDLSDRPSFIAHRAGNNGIYVTGALLGKKTGELFFDVSRSRLDANGRFNGTVQVSLYPSYLQDFYREVAEAEKDLAVTMMSVEGKMIARWPEVISQPGSQVRGPGLRALAAGYTTATVRGVSSIDNTERLISLRRIGSYPVAVSASVRISAIWAAWANDMLWPGVLTACASLALGIAGTVAIRRTRRELHLANLLYEESLQRKQVEHALLHAQKMEALGHLTGGVAHDFNNLLMVIGMNAHLLKSTVPGLGGNPRLDAIQRSVSNGAKLTRQLLSFSRRQPLVLATIDLQAELMGIIELCAPVLGKTVEMSVQVAADTPALTIDRAELELSLINLAINARRAMPDGGRFEVTARPLPAGQLEIAVRDSGCGIAPDILPRVTEPFFSTRPSGEGTGLGLSQVNTMCQRAGGSVQIESEVGQGTTIRLRFPAAITRADEAVDVPLAERSYAMRLLLVEDNPEIAAATQLALESFGCTVQRCGNADEARAWLERAVQLPDAVLSDISMPGSIDGIGFARYLREHYPELPVALMTGYAERLDDAEALQLRVLPKPFDVAALRAVLAYLAAGQAYAS
jgi:signal transduction histidine kinase/ActR/RegA family two-component response regulator